MNTDDNNRPSADDPIENSDETAAHDIRDDDATEAEDGEQAGNGLSVVPALLLMVLVVAIAGVAAYFWYEHDHAARATALAAERAALERRLADVQDSLVSMASDDDEARLAGLEDQLAGLAASTEKITRRQQELEKSVAGLFQEEKQASLEWVLAEAEYLVLAANQRLALEGDVNTAIAALRAADQRLNAAEHPDLIPVRDQIIEDIRALEAVELPDIEGLALYLAKVIEEVDELPTKPVAETIKPFSETKQLAAGAKDWRVVVNSMWTDLVELVEVKDSALPDSVLFDPELRYFLQQNLKIELASARLAALERDGHNFKASAALVQQMLSEFYDDSAPKVTSISERLAEASTYEFEPALPRITGSLDAIRARRGAVAGS